MKAKYLLILGLFLYTLSFSSFAQVTDLLKIGQTPGGASAHVNWDASTNKLIVGCGTSVWVYDMSNPIEPVLCSKRPFSGLINETDVYGDILFVAATHDGVYALDFTSPELDILAHYNMKNMGDSAAYDLWRSNDTLYVADYFKVRMLKYDDVGGFSKITSFGGPKSYCVARRGNYIAVGNQVTLITDANISVYSNSNLNTPVAQWLSPWCNWVQDIQFADLRDDIIYVCAGPETPLFDKSNFFALEFTGASLFPSDTFAIDSGLLGIAQQNIMNMDSRNDTLFLATTSAWDVHFLPYTYVAVLDASGLPIDTLKDIGKILAGLWHFDVSLMHNTPYLAIASEWCGVLLTDVSQLALDDTLGLMETGGWCVNNKVKGNTLWACMEGYGLCAYNLDSLQYSAGTMANSLAMNIYDLDNHYFSSDVEFLNDTLLIINSSEVYNIKPWQMGGEPVLEYDMNRNWMIRMNNIYTNVGQRMIATFYDIYANEKWIELIDPFDDGGGFASLDHDSMWCDVNGMTVAGDTVYYAQTVNNIRFLVAQKVSNDNFVFIDSIKLSLPFGVLFGDDVHSISVENGLVAVAYGKQFAMFKWNGSQLEELFTNFQFTQQSNDIVLRNHFVYVSDRAYGFKIYDVSSQTEATLVAQGAGTGGWTNLYGSTAISVASDGKIYLSDFHAGVLIYEAYDTTWVAAEQEHKMHVDEVRVFPNPVSNVLKITIQNKESKYNFTLYDMSGRVLKKWSCLCNSSSIDMSGLMPGNYIITVSDEKGVLSSHKIIKL